MGVTKLVSDIYGGFIAECDSTSGLFTIKKFMAMFFA
jgi:hypothetical protein